MGIVGTGRAHARSGHVTGSCGCGTNGRPRRGATAVAIAFSPGLLSRRVAPCAHDRTIVCTDAGLLSDQAFDEPEP